MGLPKEHRIEHLELSVEDLDGTIEFYTGVVGLIELARADGVVYLGCGLDDNWDVAFRQGPAAVEHVAFRADDEDEIERAERRLAEHDVPVERRDGTEPGQERGLRFELASGLGVEYVSVADKRYPVQAEPTHPRLRGFAPLDLDHIAIQATDVREASRLFLDVLGWRETEHVELEAGSGAWQASFLRKGSMHHDVTVAQGPARMHHWALAMASFDHLKMAIDTMASVGQRIELGPSRHLAGGNIFTYFRLPDGHRLELSVEMSVLDPDTPPRTWNDRAGFDAWGSLSPTPEFMVGS